MKKIILALVISMVNVIAAMQENNIDNFIEDYNKCCRCYNYVVLNYLQKTLPVGDQTKFIWSLLARVSYSVNELSLTTQEQEILSSFGFVDGQGNIDKNTRQAMNEWFSNKWVFVIDEFV